MKQTWIPTELHTHTQHSDAQHSLATLIKSATELGLSCIALTDHNTISGHLEFETLAEKSKINMIRGMEWTTFYGHMLTLGLSEYEDWRDLGEHEIEKGIERVHQRGGIVGIAHPFRVGNPICTGCHWEFEVKDWDKVDYIEVWSGLFPSVKRESIRAFEWWTELLNRGYRISGVSGRDWHNGSFTDEPIAVTYLAVDDANDVEVEASAVDSLRKGRVSVTMGPLLYFSVINPSDKQEYGLGEEVVLSDHPSSQVTAIVEVDFSTRRNFWELTDQDFHVNIMSNQGVLVECMLNKANSLFSFQVSSQDVLWVRAELFGVIHQVRTMIAFTNPIYFE